MSSFTLDQEQYEALISLARDGAVGNAQKLTQLDQFLKGIERANGVTRSFLMVQWQERSAPLPPGTRFPAQWPPRLRKSIELISRAITRVDVDAVLKQYATEPLDVLVTADPAGLVGWTTLDDYFLA
jgi:hypothetical protein